MSSYSPKQPVAADVLPIEAASETDATEILLGRQLKEGPNHLGRGRAGMELVVQASPGEPLKYQIVDAKGESVGQVIRISTTFKEKKKTTCWECGVDAEGNRHCWKVPCPDIVGPWNPDKVLTEGLVLQ
jgi:hypothetical protein